MRFASHWRPSARVAGGNPIYREQRMATEACKTNIRSLTLATANTGYPLLLSPSTKRFSVQCRSAEAVHNQRTWPAPCHLVRDRI